MGKSKPLTGNTPIPEKIKRYEFPLVLVDFFDVAEEDFPPCMQAWEDVANWMKIQRNCISTQRHRGIAYSRIYVKIAVRESVQRTRSALGHPESQEAMRA